MALTFNGCYVNDAGVHVDYWKIGGINVSIVHKYVDIQVYGYLSAETRQEGKSIIEHKMIRCTAVKYDQYFSAEELNQEGVNIIERCYRYIKENDNIFNGTVDC